MLGQENTKPPTEVTPLEPNQTHIQKYGPQYTKQRANQDNCFENSFHGDHGGESSIVNAYWNTLNTIVGIGIIGVPFALSKIGIIGGIVAMIIFGCLCTYSVMLQVRASNIMVFNLKFEQTCKTSKTRLKRIKKIIKKPHYEDLCEYCFGKKGYLFVLFCLLMLDFGALLSYLIIIADNITHVFDHIWAQIDHYNAPYIIKLFLTNRQFALFIIAIILILPACLPKDLSALERLSAFNVLTKVLLVCVVIYQFFDLTREYNDKSEIMSNVNYFDSAGISVGFGIFAFCFVANDTAFLIYNTLYKPTPLRWGILNSSAIASDVIIVILFGLFGYLTFVGKNGNNGINSNLFNNYPTNSVVMIIMRTMYAFSMAFSFPIKFYVVRHCFFEFFHMNFLTSNENSEMDEKVDDSEHESVQTASLCKHLLYTLPLFAITLAISLVVDDLGIVISLVGSISCVNLAFVLPCACYLKLTPSKLKFWNESTFDKSMKSLKTVAFPLILLIVGAFLAVFTTVGTLVTFYS